MMKSYLYSLVLVLALIMTSMLQEYSWVVDFSIVKVVSLDMSLSLYLDKQASAFLVTVLCIFSMVFMYTFSYLSSEIFLKRFLALLSLFASSMCLLILGGNLFSSLIGWDGLGVTSMFLILFYYSNSALKASTLTFLMNRIGDCFFIMTLTSVILMGESQLFYTSSPHSWQIALLLVLTSITKSAQIPFSTWLPAAMEAPTPVSSLVHSSTLVTAGIFLLFRYNQLWLKSEVSNILLVLSVSTCFMAALSAFVENDLKKLIALSTLSQLGFVMFSFSLGLLTQGYLHMLMHAYFKALLFMCAGLVIHSFKGSQSISLMGLSGSQNPMLMLIMSVSLMSMMGFPFLAGFYSKDQIIDALAVTKWSYFVYLLLVLSMLATVVYSVRVVWYLMSSASIWHCASESDYSMVKPMLPLAVLACCGGSATSWALSDIDLCMDNSKMSILCFIMITILLYWSLKSIGFSVFLESKWNLNMFNPMASKSFFHSSMMYHMSCDLSGVPEVLNNSIKGSLWSWAHNASKTMTHYSGNMEFLVFLVSILIAFYY